MALSKDRKAQLLDKARDIFASDSTKVFVHARGMTAQDTNAMRSEMKLHGVNYAVIRKTLVKKALDETSIAGDCPVLDNELAMAYGDDLIAPARLVRQFQKKHKEQMAIMGGVFEGSYLDGPAMNEIADIPDMQGLRGMFVNIINTPIQQVTTVLHALAEKKEALA